MGKRTKCVRCRFRPCESKSGVCKTCREDPAKTVRVEELAAGLAWAVRTFGIKSLRDGNGCSVVGAAKIRAALVALGDPEAVEAGDQAGAGDAGVGVHAAGVSGHRPGRGDGVSGLSAAGRGGGGPVAAGAYGVAGPVGDGRGGRHAAGVRAAAAEPGLDSEDDCEGDGEDAGVGPAVARRPGSAVAAGDCGLAAVQAMAGRKGDGAGGWLAVFPIDWPFGTLFGWRQRVIVDDAAGVVEGCSRVRVGDGWEFKYWVRVAGRLREVDEDDIDAAEEAE